jgi:hypothetical protein
MNGQLNQYGNLRVFTLTGILTPGESRGETRILTVSITFSG